MLLALTASDTLALLVPFNWEISHWTIGPQEGNVSLPFLTLLTLVVQLILKKNQTKHLQPSCLLYGALLTADEQISWVPICSLYFLYAFLCLLSSTAFEIPRTWGMRDEGFTHIQNNHKEILINAAIHYGTLLAIM